MKRGIAAAAALTTLLAAAACGGSDSDGDGDGGGDNASDTSYDSHDALVEAAKKEGGKLTINTSLPDDVVPIVEKGFEEAYPFIDAEFTIQSGSDDQRILLELQSEQSEADVLHLSPESYADYLPYVEPVDLVGMAKDGTLDIAEGMSNPTDAGVMAASSGLSGFAYNKTMMSDGDLPKTWDDLLTPAFKGRKFMVDIEPTNIAGLGAAWGEDKLMSYAKALGEQEPVWCRSDKVSMVSVSTGEHGLHVGTNYQQAYAAEQSSPDALSIGLLEPVPVRITNIQAIRKGAEHPAEATLFLEYLASDDVQHALDSGEEQPQASVYYENSTINELTDGMEVSLNGWDNFVEQVDLEEAIVKEWGFPTAEVKDDDK